MLSHNESAAKIELSSSVSRRGSRSHATRRRLDVEQDRKSVSTKETPAKGDTSSDAPSAGCLSAFQLVSQKMEKPSLMLALE